MAGGSVFERGGDATTAATVVLFGSVTIPIQGSCDGGLGAAVGEGVVVIVG
ncbi:hypothetical protein HanIR_Chr10g0465401 [Helianthus annuus]|nr:hypothetical protein HanIR_Chr10g0465401 [Helianthus annuus]